MYSGGGGIITENARLLKHPSSTLIVGVSRSGKTTLVRYMIRNWPYDAYVKKIKWCYTYFASWFLEEPGFQFIKGLPDSYEEGDLIVIDDLMRHLNEKIADLFTGASHNCNVSVILLLQNLFPRIKVMRDISLNAQYIIIFKNVRDESQVRCLGRQLYPRNSPFFMDAYIKATGKSHGYLLIDLHPETTHELRLRDGIYPDTSGLCWFFTPQ